MSQPSGQLAPNAPPRGELAPSALAAARSWPGAQPEQALFRLDLRRSFEMHRKLALGFVVFGILVAGAYLFRHWPIYNAEALVYIQPTPSGVGGVVMHWPYNYDPSTYESYIQQQIISMTRPDVLHDAVGKIDGWQQSGESEQDATDRLGHAIEVQRVQTSYQVSITAHARDAQMAADMANAVANAYIDSTRHEQKAGSAEREAMLRDERERVKKELAGDRTEQAQLSAQLGVAAVGAAVPEHFDSDIAAVHQELVKARADHDEAEARLAALVGNGSNSAALDAQADEIASADPGLTSLKTALDTRRAALVSQMANLTPNHPLYKQDAAELTKIDANLQKATQELQTKAAARVQEKLQSDLARTAGVEARLNAELGQMTHAAVGATPRLQRAADLAGDITRLQNRYDALDEQLQNQMIEDAAPERAHITTPAAPPLHPAENGVIRNSIVLLFGFSFLGLLAAVAAQKMDPRLYAASDVEQVLGFAPMAQLPDFGEVSEAVADEHLLRLSAALEHARRRDHLKNCILTATGPGAGVTTIATRVRALLEGMGRPAVLVDAMGRSASGDEQPGTARTTRSLALLQQLAQEAKAQDESLVLTDTAPLTLSAETEYLARNTDCAIVVMEAGVTTRAQLRATAHALQRLDVGAVGFVLNRVGMAKADPAFRSSVRDIELHLRAQGRSSAETSVRTRRVEVFADEEAPIGQEARIEEPPARAQVEAPVRASIPVSAARPEPAQPIEKREEAASAQNAPAPAAAAELPLWLSDAPAHAPQAPEPMVSQPRAPQSRPREAGVPLGQRPSPAVTGSSATGFSAPGLSVPAPFVMESRLSGLRNLLSLRPAEPSAKSSQADPAPHASIPAAPSPETIVDWSQASSPRRMPQAPPPSAERFAEPPAPHLPQVQFEHVAAQPPYPAPEPELEPVPATVVPLAPSTGSTRRVTTTPEFLPPRKTRTSRLEEEATRRDRRDTFDDVSILPSWRGQYRRKD